MGNKFIHPWDAGRLRDAVKILERENNEPQVRNLMQDILARYEQTRIEGRHPGPALSGLRFYELKWSIDPWATNRNDPDEWILLVELP